MLASINSKVISSTNGIMSSIKEEPPLEEDYKMTNNGVSSDLVPVPDDDNQLYQFKPYGQQDQCDLNPEFAVICSFISHFGDKLDFKLDIEKLKTSIEDQTYLDNELIDLHVKLLRKVRRYFVRDQWEKVLIRFASEYSYEDAYELEVLGYLKSRPSIKLELLRRLMEAQFECDQKFKASINLSEANELRILPIGRDVNGNTYWQRTDQEGNLRIFQEEPLDYKTWKTICTTTGELHELINQLESKKDLKIKGEPMKEPYNPLPEVFPEFFKEEIKKEEAEPPDTRTTKSKKTRGRGKALKSSSLSAVEESKGEDQCNIEPEKAKPSNYKLTNDMHFSLKDNSISPVQSESYHKISIESQVKSTLENLLNVVVSSFDYLIKPLSRGPSPQDKEQDKQSKPQKKKRITNRDKPREEVLPRRTSSRIQQLQMKKIAEQEEVMKKLIESNAHKKESSITSHDDDSRSRSSSSKNNKRRSESPQNENRAGKRRRNKIQSWKRSKGKKKLSWDKDDSDLSSTSSLTESNEDDLEELDDSYKFESTNYDDEFACEDEETNVEPVIVKRARTARQSLGLDDLCDPNTSSILEEDKPCGRCDKSNDPEWILLCDNCDDGYHTSCCLPPLMIVPDGDWFCPSCEHNTLISKLTELRASVVEILEVKERERKKNQRLRQNAVKREPVQDETQQEVLAQKRKDNFSNELDDSLEAQALDDDFETNSDDSYREKFRKRTKKGSKNKKPTRRKSKYEEDTAFISHSKRPIKTYSRRSMMIESDESEDVSAEQASSSSDEIAPKARRACASVSYRFQEYDELIKSAIHGDSFAGEESESNSTPDNSNYGKGKDMATIEALAYQQENGITDDAIPQAEENQEDAYKQRGKKKGRRLNDLNDASESENNTSDESFQATSATEAEDEEEDDDDEMTEEDVSESEETSIDELIDVSRFKSKKKMKGKNKKRQNRYDSDESDYQPTRTRRAAAAKKVSYRESTDEEDAELELSTKRVKNSLSSGEESQASWKSHAASIIEDDQSTSCAESPELKIDESKQDKDESHAEVEDKEPKDSRVSISGNQLILPTEPELTNSIESSELNIKAPYKSESGVTQEKLVVKVQSPDKVKIAKQKQEQTTQSNSSLRPTNIVDRNPIQELNQYCSESANSAFMFKSYNDTLNSKSSPIHPPPHEEDLLRPTTSVEKPRKAKIPKSAARASEASSPEKAVRAQSLSDRKVSAIPPILNNPRFPLPTNIHMNSHPRPPIRPTATDVTIIPQQYQNSQSQVGPNIYTLQSNNITYARSPYPAKYSQQHPSTHSSTQNQVHRYPNTYDGHLNSFNQQTPRPSVVTNPYSNPHLQGRMWSPNMIVPGEAPRQPLLNLYYETSAPVPNPNFSIHQLLRNPYTMEGMPPSSNAQLPNSGSISQVHTPTSTQSSVSSETNDRDIIRGMSDVISFIGDI